MREILSTETGDGTWQPNTWLVDEIRQAIRELDDRNLCDLLDPGTDEFRYLDAVEYASRLATALAGLQDACLAHPMEIIRVLARDPAVIVSDELSEKLGLEPGRMLQSILQAELIAIFNPPDTTNN